MTIKKQRTIILAIAVFISYTSTVLSSEKGIHRKWFTPEKISIAVKEKGAAEVLKQIQNSQELTDLLSSHLRNGDQKWLELFVTLRQHPEFESGGLLDLYLAYAIAENPKASLNVMQQYQTKYQNYFVKNEMPSYATLVCGNVDEDWELGCEPGQHVKDIAKSAYDALQFRQLSLEFVDSNERSQIKTDCLNEIVKAKKFWEKYCHQ